MIDNNALEHELDAELRNLLLPYLRNRRMKINFRESYSLNLLINIIFFPLV